MAKTSYIELATGDQFPILYEDRSVMAIDKPATWMLVPFTWQKTDRNLQAAITSSIAEGAFWARSRNLKFLQAVHRLDAETSGILLLVKNRGAIKPISDLFESRQMEKRYWVVMEGRPKQTEWTCKLPLGPDPSRLGSIRVDSHEGKSAETHFRVLQQLEDRCFVEARPVTGRTHQIRVHAAQTGHPVVGDVLYNPRHHFQRGKVNLALRSVFLAFRNPFDGRPVTIQAPTQDFLREYRLKTPSDIQGAQTKPVQSMANEVKSGEHSTSRHDTGAKPPGLNAKPSGSNAASPRNSRPASPAQQGNPKSKSKPHPRHSSPSNPS